MIGKFLDNLLVSIFGLIAFWPEILVVALISAIAAAGVVFGLMA